MSMLQIMPINVFPTDFLSAGPHVTVSSGVGSTALLPCKLTNIYSQTLHVRWRTNYGVVFERNGNKTSPGPGYEGRVNISEGELRKGNCSLVLNNVRLTDDSFYKAYTVEYEDSANKWNKLNSVKISVSGTYMVQCTILRKEQ